MRDHLAADRADQYALLAPVMREKEMTSISAILVTSILDYRRVISNHANMAVKLPRQYFARALLHRLLK